MKKKIWFLFATVLVCTASLLFAAEHLPDPAQEAMEKVLAIVSDRVLNGPPGTNEACRPEAADCLSLLAKTVYSGDICTTGMTWNGLNFLYGEARSQKVLHPELKDAFNAFLTHVGNHRAQLANGQTGGASPSY